MDIIKLYGQELTEASIRRQCRGLRSSEQSIVVIGPRGCGKSTHAERMALGLGLSVVVDDWNGCPLPQTGFLALTTHINGIARKAVQARAHPVVEFKRVDHLIGIRQAKLARAAIDAIC